MFKANQKEKTTMAGKPPLKFTPFHVSVRQRLLNAWATTKRYAGTSAVGGVVAVLAPIPGPHTIVLLGGMAIGAGVAWVTREKK